MQRNLQLPQQQKESFHLKRCHLILAKWQKLCSSVFLHLTHATHFILICDSLLSKNQLNQSKCWTVNTATPEKTAAASDASSRTAIQRSSCIFSQIHTKKIKKITAALDKLLLVLMQAAKHLVTDSHRNPSAGIYSYSHKIFTAKCCCLSIILQAAEEPVRWGKAKFAGFTDITKMTRITRIASFTVSL